MFRMYLVVSEEVDVVIVDMDERTFQRVSYWFTQLETRYCERFVYHFRNMLSLPYFVDSITLFVSILGHRFVSFFSPAMQLRLLDPEFALNIMEWMIHMGPDAFMLFLSPGVSSRL